MVHQEVSVSSAWIQDANICRKMFFFEWMPTCTFCLQGGCCPNSWVWALGELEAVAVISTWVLSLVSTKRWNLSQVKDTANAILSLSRSPARIQIIQGYYTSACFVFVDIYMLRNIFFVIFSDRFMWNGKNRAKMPFQEISNFLIFFSILILILPFFFFLIAKKAIKVMRWEEDL